MLPPPRAKLTLAISSNRICSGGLCIYIKPRSKGYKNPAAALYEQLTAGVPECLQIIQHVLLTNSDNK